MYYLNSNFWFYLSYILVNTNIVIIMDDLIIKIGLLFYLSSILGYIYELILCYFYTGKLFSHGILSGPWLPIYGIGSLFILLINRYKDKPLIIFALSFLITGILEYTSGLFLLKVFKMRLWDYTNRIFNIDGLVCLLSAFCFGIGGLIITYLIEPFINKILQVCSKEKINKILNILNSMFIGDIIATALN